MSGIGEGVENEGSKYKQNKGRKLKCNKRWTRIIVQSPNRVVPSNPMTEGKSKIVAGEKREKRSKPGNTEFITLILIKINKTWNRQNGKNKI